MHQNMISNILDSNILHCLRVEDRATRRVERLLPKRRDVVGGPCRGNATTSPKKRKKKTPTRKMSTTQMTRSTRSCQRGEVPDVRGIVVDVVVRFLFHHCHIQSVDVWNLYANNFFWCKCTIVYFGLLYARTCLFFHFVTHTHRHVRTLLFRCKYVCKNQESLSFY